MFKTIFVFIVITATFAFSADSAKTPASRINATGSVVVTLQAKTPAQVLAATTAPTAKPDTILQTKAVESKDTAANHSAVASDTAPKPVTSDQPAVIKNDPLSKKIAGDSLASKTTDQPDSEEQVLESPTESALKSFPLTDSVPPKPKDSTWTIYTVANSDLSHNYVKSIAQEKDGSLWIGTYYGGAEKFDGSTWTKFKTKTCPLPNDLINGIAVDNNNDKWFATGAGVAKYDGEQWTVYSTKNSELPSNNILCITTGPNNAVLIGTANNGAARLDGSKWTPLTKGYESVGVLAIAVDFNNIPWIGTTGNGAGRFNGWKLIHYTTKNSLLPSNTVTGFAYAKNNVSWIATSQGIVKCDGTQWSVWNTSNSPLPSKSINAIAVDRNSTAWLATSNGLVQIKGKQWKVFRPKNSAIPDTMINTVMVDKDNALWIGTCKGLVRYKGL
jgi:hypothetical protein